MQRAPKTEDIMLRWRVVVGLSLSLAASGIHQGYAQRSESAVTLTALDYVEIEQLYATYNRAVDLGDTDGLDYSALYLPDGIFINVVPSPASGSCQPPNPPWHAADRSVIRGSLADKRGGNMCITTLNGSLDLAMLA